MKRNLIAAIALISTICLFSQMVQAQQIYVGLEGSYGLKISPQDNTWFFTNVDQTGSVQTYKKVDFSLGQGFQTGITLGYMFSENIGADLGLAYFGGTACKAYYSNTDTLGVTETMDYSFKATMFRINPSLLLSVTAGKISPYMKFGVVLSTGSLEEVHEGVNNGDFIKTEYQYNKGMALGLSAAAGGSFKINDRFSVFGEFRMINMAYSPGKRVTTESSVNGVDLLPSLTTADKIVEYVDSYEYDYNNQPSQNEPSHWLKENYSLNSIGLNIGVRFNL